MTIINDCFVEEQRDTLANFFEHGLLGLNGYIDDNLLQDCFALQRFCFSKVLLKASFEFLEPLRDSAKFKRV